MPLDTLHNALLHEMSDLLSAEKQIAKALQQVAKAANDQELKEMAQQHHEETLQQAQNLQDAFAHLGARPEKMLCKGAAGIVEENNSTLKEEKPKDLIKDITLIGGSLRIEHYEIAGYRSAIATARALGQKEVVKLLQTNLKQEEATAKKLEAAAQAMLKAMPQDGNGNTPAATQTAPAKKTSAGTAKAPAKRAPAAKAGARKTGTAKAAARKPAPKRAARKTA
jgi:ferritin-like metal-binding protein YciE